MTQSQQTQDLVCFDNFEQIRQLKGYRPDNRGIAPTIR